ncbi:MAG: M23 family metallopeptidase [Chloroflexi bacterium]|nr:M23 family metallopeptidase [Chloroflexota bacterium]
MFKFIRRNILILPLALLLAALVAGLAYIAGTLGTLGSGMQIHSVAITLTPPRFGTPVALLAQIDPAVIQVIDNSGSAANPLDNSVQPIGAYLPQTGSTQFQLPLATPLPTLLPYPTSPPLPVTPLGPFVPTVDAALQEGILAYGGVDCAPSGLPVSGVLTQRFHAYHSGIDIGVPIGTPIQATHSGTVTFAGWSDVGYGYLVIIQNGSFITYYAHQTSYNVYEGQTVGRGSLVGWSGSTGRSTGPHVHYETRVDDIPVDPLTFEARGYFSC